jgi:predicted negative regulator of RcsB-dependent stress response
MEETPTNPEVNELSAQCQWLRRQIQTILILLILVSATLTGFLWMQVRYAGRDLSTQYRPAIEEWTKKQGPAIDDFVRKLADYGRQHPDFNAIYIKYGLNQATQAPPSTVAPKK